MMSWVSVGGGHKGKKKHENTKSLGFNKLLNKVVTKGGDKLCFLAGFLLGGLIF